MPQFSVGIDGAKGATAPPPFDIDPASGLPGGTEFPQGFGDRAFSVIIEKPFKLLLERIVGFVTPVGPISSEVGSRLIYNTAGQGEEARILYTIALNNALHALFLATRGGVWLSMGTTDP